MKINSLDDISSRLGKSKIMIYLYSQQNKLDELETFQKLSAPFLFSNELYSNNFFNNTVSIIDNLDFHGMQHNFKKDFFFKKLNLEKDLNYYKNKRDCNSVLWRLSSQTCYLLVNKYYILDASFRLNFPKNEIQSSSERKACLSIKNYMDGLLREKNYVFLANKRTQISRGYNQYILCNESNFIECYNNANSLRKELKKYA